MPPKIATQFIAPTSRAFGRMTTILFRPFDLGKWFVLGFTAWLATLLDGSSSSSNMDFSGFTPDAEGEVSGPDDFETIEDFKEWVTSSWGEVLVFLEENAWVVPTVIGGVVFLIVLGVVLTWLSARGKLMFLDNIAHNRALVKMPWREYRREGNSLFWWLMIFGFASSVLFLGVLGGTGYWLYNIIDFENPFTREVITAGSVGIGVFLLLILVSVLVVALQNAVVIPQMYQHRIGVSEAWVRALRLLKQRFWGFIGFILWSFVLNLAAAIIILVVTLITCCIAGLLMAIPYLGAVITLPVTVFFYALGPEFIRQFGEEYDIWADDPDHYKMVPHAPEQ